VRKQCELLSIHRSRVYYQHREQIEDVLLMNEIYELWMAHPYFGYRRIWAMLVRTGRIINRKRVARLMNAMNLEAIYPKPKTSIRNKEHKIFPYLLREYFVSQKDQVWMVDISYIPMREGFIYLAAIIDVYSRYIVGWNISITLDTESCVEALEKALKNGTCKILNSDQGCQFTSTRWVERVQMAGIEISMDGKGRCLDNVFIERFWRSLKQEDVYLKAYETVPEARKAIAAYIELYNFKRPHQSLDYKTPAEVYLQEKKDSVDLLSWSFEFLNLQKSGNQWESRLT
jgi:putative transposase